MRDADECEYDLSYQTNVMAKHTAWQTYSPNITIIQKGATCPFILTELLEKCSFCPLQI